MLRALSRQLLDAAVKAEQSAQLPTIGTLTEISQLATPIYGQVDGIGRVTITADGNMHGFPPVMRCVDTEGEVAWIPTDRILVGASWSALAVSARSWVVISPMAPRARRLRRTPEAPWSRSCELRGPPTSTLKISSRVERSTLITGFGRGR
jgi:hypothetical protein